MPAQKTLTWIMLNPLLLELGQTYQQIIIRRLISKADLTQLNYLHKLLYEGNFAHLPPHGYMIETSRIPHRHEA